MELDSEGKRGSCGKSVNRIIHARKPDVGWETLPKNASVIPEGAIIIPYVQAETDRRPLAFIDPFALRTRFYTRPCRFWIFAATQPLAGARTKRSRIAPATGFKPICRHPSMTVARVLKRWVSLRRFQDISSRACERDSPMQLHIAAGIACSRRAGGHPDERLFNSLSARLLTLENKANTKLDPVAIKVVALSHITASLGSKRA